MILRWRRSTKEATGSPDTNDETKERQRVAVIKYTQVYKPDGKWYCTFYRREDAEVWVGKQPDAERWEITDRRPARQEAEVS